MTETAEHTPRRVKAAILRTLAGSAHPRLEAPNLAHRFNMTVDDVKAIAAAHGGLDQPTRLLKAAQVLEQQNGTSTEQGGFVRHGVASSTNPADRVTFTTPTSIPRPTEPGSVEQLLARADKSSKARTRNTAAKIRTLLEDLTTRVEEEARARREKARLEEERRQAETAAREEREKARAEVEALEKKLAKAKAKLRGKPATSTKTPTGDVPCPVTGCARTFANRQGAATHHTRVHRSEELAS